MIYRWLHRLGSGNSGVVWAAERQGETIAVKVLRVKPGSAQAEAIRRELKIGPLIDGHPGVVAVRKEEIFGNSLCLEMDLIKGPSLAQVLEELAMGGKEAIPPTVAVAWMLDVLETLDWVGRRVAPTHPRSFAHRDLKPSNLLLDPAGRLRIADFGIARAEASLGFQVTRTGVTKGNPRYLAPEAVRPKGTVDARADQYAVAVVLYELLAGKPLYEDQDVESLFHQLEQARVEDALGALKVPDSLLKVMRKMLARDPGDRFPSHRATATALGAITVPGPAPRAYFRTMRFWAPGTDSAADTGSQKVAKAALAEDPGTDALTGEHDTEEVTGGALNVHILRHPPLSEVDDGPTVVGMEPPPDRPKNPSTIGGWLRSTPRSDLEDESEHTVGGWLAPADDVSAEHTIGGWLRPVDDHDPEHTVGGWLSPEPEPEHTVGEWLRADEEPERTVGEWLRPEGAEVQMIEPENTGSYGSLPLDGDLSQISGTSYPAVRPVPLVPRGPAGVPLDDSTLNISNPLMGLDAESTHIVPSLAYSQRVPATMDSKKRQQIQMFALVGVVLFALGMLATIAVAAAVVVVVVWG